MGVVIGSPERTPTRALLLHAVLTVQTANRDAADLPADMPPLPRPAGWIPRDWCEHHHTREPFIEGAPWCPECWHHFASDDDLVEQDFRVQVELGHPNPQRRPVERVFVCPYCCHDL